MLAFGNNVQIREPKDQSLAKRLTEIYGVNLSWSAEPGKSDVLERRQRALDGLRSHPKPMANKRAVSKRPRARPRKLSWHDERMIAVFIATRELGHLPVKNAVTDAMQRFGISRATVFRIRRTHGVNAKHMALLLMKHGRKTFRTFISVKRRALLPDFSDWGPDCR